MAILDMIGTLGVDAVAMCSHSRSILRQIFWGSTVQSVMPRCPVPLIIVHDPGDASESETTAL
jgi:nucleotide-binding universal stress UspA family protein